jgi:hypothetical protein
MVAPCDSSIIASMASGEWRWCEPVASWLTYSAKMDRSSSSARVLVAQTMPATPPLFSDITT